MIVLPVYYSQHPRSRVRVDDYGMFRIRMKYLCLVLAVFSLLLLNVAIRPSMIPLRADQTTCSLSSPLKDVDGAVIDNSNGKGYYVLSANVSEINSTTPVQDVDFPLYWLILTIDPAQSYTFTPPTGSQNFCKVTASGTSDHRFYIWPVNSSSTSQYTNGVGALLRTTDIYLQDYKYSSGGHNVRFDQFVDNTNLGTVSASQNNVNDSNRNAIQIYGEVFEKGTNMVYPIVAGKIFGVQCTPFPCSQYSAMWVEILIDTSKTVSPNLGNVILETTQISLQKAENFSWPVVSFRDCTNGCGARNGIEMSTNGMELFGAGTSNLTVAQFVCPGKAPFSDNCP
jgi:hypothetical protein